LPPQHEVGFRSLFLSKGDNSPQSKTEPDAHKIATMQNQIDKELMESFAKVAGEFMFDGSVIA
jgi:hypothetical protein